MLALVAAAVLTSSPSFPSEHGAVGARELFSPPPLVEADVPLVSSQEHHKWFGLVFDAGAPTGAGISLAWRPFSWVQLQLGGATNGVAPGARAGLVISPFKSFARPTLSAHVGRFAEGDGEALARAISGDDSLSVPILSKVQYDYASAYLGLELGNREGTSFFIRAGVSRTVARLGGFEEQLRAFAGSDSLSASSPELTLTTPSAQLGFSIFL